MHDGILIGVGTALNDNPQLNGSSSVYLVAFTTLFENHCYQSSPTPAIPLAGISFPLLSSPSSSDS